MLRKLRKSPLNYWSDLFIVTMVLAWIIVMGMMLIMATYSTIANNDNAIWSDLGILCGIPLSCGGGVWMIKNSVVHYMSKKQGKEAEYDFPKVEETDIDMEEKEDE